MDAQRTAASYSVVTIASASISTSMSLSIKRDTSTMLVAGRIVPKTLAVRFADVFPVTDVGHVDAGADDVFKSRTRVL